MAHATNPTKPTHTHPHPKKNSAAPFDPIPADVLESPTGAYTLVFQTARLPPLGLKGWVRLGSGE